MTDAQVDWQQQTAEFASKSARHSKAVDAAHAQVVQGDLTGDARWEATYTLAVQRFHMDGVDACRD